MEIAANVIYCHSCALASYKVKLPKYHQVRCEMNLAHRRVSTKSLLGMSDRLRHFYSISALRNLFIYLIEMTKLFFTLDGKWFSIYGFMRTNMSFMTSVLAKRLWRLAASVHKRNKCFNKKVAETCSLSSQAKKKRNSVRPYFSFHIRMSHDWEQIMRTKAYKFLDFSRIGKFFKHPHLPPPSPFR